MTFSVFERGALRGFRGFSRCLASIFFQGGFVVMGDGFAQRWISSKAKRSSEPLLDTKAQKNESTEKQAYSFLFRTMGVLERLLFT